MNKSKAAPAIKFQPAPQWNFARRERLVRDFLHLRARTRKDHYKIFPERNFLEEAKKRLPKLAREIDAHNKRANTQRGICQRVREKETDRLTRKIRYGSEKDIQNIVDLISKE